MPAVFSGVSVEFMCVNKGNTSQRASGDFARNLHTSDTKQTLIFHKNAREYIKYSLRFLFHLTKNLTVLLSHNLCAVLPKNKEGLPRKMAVPLFEKEIGIYYLRETQLSP